MSRSRKDDMRSSHNHLMKGGPPVPADAGAGAPRPPVLADAGAGAPRPRMDDAERRAAIEKAQAEGWAKKQADIAAAVRAAAASAPPRTIERFPDRKRGELASARETGRRSRSPVSTPISSMEAPRPVPSSAAPRPDRSVSPNLTEVTEKCFRDNHLHRAESPTPLVTRAKEAASRRRQTNTMISLDHEGRKQLYEKLNRSTTQSTFRDPVVRRREIDLSPIRSAGMTMDKYGNVMDDNSAFALRKIKVRGYRSPTSTEKSKVDHLGGYK